MRMQQYSDVQHAKLCHTTLHSSTPAAEVLRLSALGSSSRMLVVAWSRTSLWHSHVRLYLHKTAACVTVQDSWPDIKRLALEGAGREPLAAEQV